MKERSSKRVPRRIQTEFRTAGAEKSRRGFTSNLSMTGMFLAANSPYPVGALVRVKLLVETPLELNAIVVHARRGLAGAPGAVQSGMGLRFLSSSSGLAELLGLQTSPSEGPVLAADDAAESAQGETESDTGTRKAPVERIRPSEPSESEPFGAEDRSKAEETPSQPAEGTRVAALERHLAEAEREKTRLRERVSSLELTLAGLQDTDPEPKA